MFGDTLNDVVCACLRADDFCWGILSLRQDPLFRLFSKEQVRQIIRDAADCGRNAAASLRRQEGGKADPIALAHRMRMEVQSCEPDQFRNPQVVNFAQYCDRKILLSAPMIRAIEREIPSLDCREELGDFSVAKLLTAHELYHCLEERDPSHTVRTIRVSIVQMGFFRRTVTPMAAGEIAAFAFAKELLRLPFYPRLVEIIGLWSTHPAIARQIAQQLYEQCGRVMDGGMPDRKNRPAVS